MLLRSVPVDVLLAVTLTGLTVATMLGQRDDAPHWAAVVLAALTVAPIALRQRAPVLTTVVILTALIGLSLFRYDDFPNGGLGILIGMFTVATLRPRRVAGLVFLAAVAVTAFVYCVHFTAPVYWSQVAQVTLVVLGAWALGESTKMWSRRAERLAAQAAQAASDERMRIAREMHDIVSHHMSVVSLQAGLAECVVRTDPDTAHTAIATAGEASRQALSELRRLLDVLRLEPESGPEDRSQPGLAQLEELVTGARSAGLPVDLSVAGRVFPLPPGPDLCAYRVVQESLTNVLKHAGPAIAKVDLEYGTRALTVRISDNGTRDDRPRQPSSRSHGIQGMRERAELYGGVLTAGHAEGGGFTVLLRLPVGAPR
ncbi:sensor histidine kinase [Micromonospora sp. NPDC048871]|uniref:sensor histidine kinase n=1 Tax=unclassified Micromonospora TaxID=2617518 RepID=UPI002E14A11B|nr:histidine kinase [Micromonospora sp. NBC_01739]